MARPRPPRDRDSAPGEQPGAESFASSEPQGIVRLSDLFAPEDFDAPSKTASRSAKKSHARNAPADGRDRARVADDTRARQAGSTSSNWADNAGGDATPAVQVVWDSRRPNDPTSANVVEGGADTGPVYESLFGIEGDTRRRPKRERKPATAMQRALGLLTRREHSRKELTRKLVSRGVDAAEVEAAVDKLTGAGWQDDRRFAESLVRSRAANGYGPLHIRAELGTHDLPAEVRQSALDEFEGDWTEIARDLVERRFARIEDPRLRERKAGDYLLRRGFPSDVVRAAIRFPTAD